MSHGDVRAGGSGRRRARRGIGGRWMRAVYALEYRVGLAVVWMIRTIPEGAAIALARGIGHACRLHRFSWGVARRNVAAALGPQVTPNEADGIARRCFVNACVSAVESVRSLSSPPGEVAARMEVVGLDTLRNALAKGRGVILFTGHIGNWELYGSWIAHNVHPVGVLARVQRNPALNRLLVRLRRRTGVEMLPKQTPPLVIRSYLKDGYILVFLADQHGGPSGVDVTFFGRATTAPRGPALYALRTGAVLVPAYGVRLSDRPLRHRLVCCEPVDWERTGDIRRDVQRATQQALCAIETAIRSYPDQWLWMNRRFRDAPARTDGAPHAPPLRPGPEETRP